MSASLRLETIRTTLADGGRARPRLLVGGGDCGRAHGSAAIRDALSTVVERRGLDLGVVEVGCDGRCSEQVRLTLTRPGEPEVSTGCVTPGDAAVTLDRLLVGDCSNEPSVGITAQHRLVMRDFGLIDATQVHDYLDRGGYAALARVLDTCTPEQVVEEVQQAGLIGRGGAYFPAAVKWQGARAARGEPKWLVVNAEEGEPGVVKDRHLLNGDPHRLLEGILLAAYAIGASQGILYINGEARLSQRRAHTAVEQARALGLLGESVLGSRFSFSLELRHGAGGYILGEETALLESIEGGRAMPRVRPPFPVESGLWGLPTVINNAETIATLRSLLELGGKAFSSIGLSGASGTKMIGLSGDIARPGLYEIPFGTTMRTLLETIGGGVPNGRSLKAVLIGGPSGVFVPASALDQPIQPRGDVPSGTGGWIVLDETRSVFAAARQMTAFNAEESCGKCTPCREGTVRLLHLMDHAVEGSASPADLAEISGLAEVVEYGSLCGLGQMAPRPILTALQHFASELQSGACQPGGQVR